MSTPTVRFDKVVPDSIALEPKSSNTFKHEELNVWIRLISLLHLSHLSKMTNTPQIKSLDSSGAPVDATSKISVSTPQETSSVSNTTKCLCHPTHLLQVSIAVFFLQLCVVMKE